ncbi:MAG: 30S ribosomal protein S4 [uncultured bacterium]|nr:MAG: 30S ribosomal protein S4 [uncultured bacterium]
MKEAVCKKCRREQAKLFLKGERCLSSKCSFVKRPYAPGPAGQNRAGKFSDYKKQLRAKQKARTIYGIYEKQFKKYYLEAAKSKGMTGATLLQLLERRLDNVVYRSGFCFSRAEAKQYISHRHVMVNDKILNIPSYLIKENDTIKLIDKDKKINKKSEIPVWIKLDNKDLKASIIKYPTREDIETEIEEQLIVEFYSR